MEPNYLHNKETLLTISSLMMTECIPKNSVMLLLTKKMKSKLPKNMQEYKEKKYQLKKNNKKKQFRKQKKTLTSTSKLMIQKTCNLDSSMNQPFSMLLMFKFNSLMMLKYLILPKCNFNILTTLKISKMPKMIQTSN